MGCSRTLSDLTRESCSILVDQRFESVFWLKGIEEFPVEDDLVLKGLLARQFEPILPVCNFGIHRSGLAQIATHGLEKFGALGAVPWRRSDRLDAAGFFPAERIVMDFVAFGDDARKAGSLARERAGPVQSRSCDRKPGRIGFEMALDQSICNLIVSSTANSMNENIGKQKPEKDGEH